MKEGVKRWERKDKNAKNNIFGAYAIYFWL